MPNGIILNTRPLSQSSQTCEDFSNCGFEVINFPCIEIVQSKNTQQCLRLFNKISPKSLVIFTSLQAVVYAFKIVPNWKISQSSVVMAVGTKTEQYLEQYIDNTIFVPDQQNSQGVINLLQGIKINSSITLITAENGRQEIHKYAKDNGIALSQINVYSRQLPTCNGPLEWINDNLDISILATSISILVNLKLLLENRDWLILQNQLVVCASTRIENYAHKIGLKNTMNTGSANPKVMAQKLNNYLSST